MKALLKGSKSRFRLTLSFEQIKFFDVMTVHRAM